MNKKSIAIIGEGPTEKIYFDQLRVAEKVDFKILPDFTHSNLEDMIQKAQRCVAEGYDDVFVLVDMDIILSEKSKRDFYEMSKKDNPRIKFVESNPCTEYWFLMHFLPSISTKEYTNYDEVVKDLRKHIPGYDKCQRVLSKIRIYQTLKNSGDMENAIKMSETLERKRIDHPEEYPSYSYMHQVIKKIYEYMNDKG